MATDVKATKKGSPQDNLAALIAQIQANSSNYTPKTGKQIRDEANRNIGGKYAQQRLAAEQAYQSNDQALARELAGLQASYDEQRQQSREAYDNAYRQADRQSTNRGMQRSSFNNATLSNIANEGAEARQKINEAQSQHAGNIEAQRTLLANQLNATLQQQTAQKMDELNAYIASEEQKEYDRQQANIAQQNQLAMQLYQFQHQLEQEQQEQANWQAQFDAQYGGRTGGGSGGGKPSGSGSGDGTKLPGGINLTALLNSLMGSNGSQINPNEPNKYRPWRNRLEQN